MEMEHGMENVNKVNVEEKDILQEHPLLNPVVVKRMFSLLESIVSAKDLKNFRLVCKLWNETSLKMWRELAPLRLGPPVRSIQTRSQSSSHFPPEHYLPVNNFLELMNDPLDTLQLQRKPFKSLVLSGIHFTDHTPDCLKDDNDSQNLWNFLSNPANQIKSFTVSECSFSWRAYLWFGEALVQNVGLVGKLILSNNQLPTNWSDEDVLSHNNHEFGMALLMKAGKKEADNLQINDCRLECLEIVGQTPINLMSFTLSQASLNLKEIIVRDNYSYDPGNSLYHALFGLHINRAYNLRKIDVLKSRILQSMGAFMWSWVTTDSKNSFPLEFLSLTLETYVASQPSRFDCDTVLDLGQVLYRMVEPVANSLKILKVFRAPIHNVIPENVQLFPVEMTALEELYLYGNLVGSWAFLQLTPNLKVLRIETLCLSMADHMEQLYFPGRLPDKVNWFRERYYPFWNDLLDRTDPALLTVIRLERMTQLHLECKLTSETIQLLGNWMPNLKVFKGIMSDYVWKAVCQWMSGLEEVGILRGSMVGEKALTGWENGNKELEETGRDPNNITTLNELKRFQYMASCGKSCIGNLAVRRGFLEMRRLEMVNLCVNKNFSPEAEQELRDHVPKVRIVRNTNEGCQGDFDCCVEAAFIAEITN